MKEQEIKITKLTAKSLVKILEDIDFNAEISFRVEEAYLVYKSRITTLIKTLKELS